MKHAELAMTQIQCTKEQDQIITLQVERKK